MTNPDDTMRRIEEALDDLLNAYDAMDTVRADIAHAKLLATIRAALQPVSVPYQLDAEHERAVEAWAARFDSAMLSYSHDWGLPDEEAYKPFGVAEKQAEIRAVLNDALRLMRRQPKETTDGK